MKVFFECTRICVQHVYIAYLVDLIEFIDFKEGEIKPEFRPNCGYLCPTNTAENI